MASAAPSGMIGRIKGILTAPKTEWTKIDAEPMTTNGIMTGWVIPLAAIPVVASLVGLLIFGFSWLGTRIVPATSFLIANAVVSYVLALVNVFVFALVIDALAPSFGGQKNSVQALKVAAFSATAGWVGGIFALVPMLSIISLLFFLYGLYILYVGLPMLMRVPQDKAIAYLIVAILVALVLYVVIGSVAAAVTWQFAPPFAVPAVTFGG